tara:strand:- start:252 stop:1433 length:1182 start_codon:yes stop_codon:yes gene_type:complete
LNKIIFVGAITILLLFSHNVQVLSQSDEPVDVSKYYEFEGFDSGFAEVVHHDKLVFEIGRDSTVHIKQIIKGDKWDPTAPKVLKLFPGVHSNPQLTDEEGYNLRPWGWTAETFEEAEYVIIGQKPFFGFDAIIEYDLENYMEFENGLWTKHFKFPHDIEIYMDDEINLVFANSRPVDVSEAKGINCVGCEIMIEYFADPKITTKTLIKNENKLEEISNTGEEFVLEFQSSEKIGDVKYVQEFNYLGFTVKNEQIVSIKIPLGLLLSPYHVYLTEFDQEILIESDQIFKSEYGQTDTHANLVFKAPIEGVVHVVGGTEMEHEKLLEKIEKRVVEASKVPEPVPEPIVEEENLTEFYEEWGESNANSNEDNLMIFVIVGIIAAIIIGVVIKLKKN